jgi:chromosome segregation ATPase
MWRELLETETTRREQAEEANKSLREEILRLKAETISMTSNDQDAGGREAATKQVNGLYHDSLNNGVSASDSSTLVEHFRHENAELRRDLSAQASMLTSRNRERDRLYQEIEDLKMGRRRGDGPRSLTGDSILDRSASRAYGRPGSRASDATPVTQISEAERESYETQIGELRDQISGLKIDKHSLTEECDRAYDAGEQLKSERDELKRQLEYISNQTEQEILAFERERDEALVQREDYQTRFKNLQEEAQQRLDAVEDELDQKTEYIERLETELANNDEIINTLRNEVRMLSEGLNRVEAEVQAKIRRIQEVELENEDINRELEGLEKSLREVNEKSEKLTVELESRQNECAFLREEQDGCMLKIGDLEAELKSTTASLSSEKGRSKDLEARLAEERHQREIVGTKEKQEVQKILNDQNRELSAAKEALRKLNIELEQRESEVATWKERI